jgi:FAD/FMN-containing dehydrogenase
VTPALLDFGDGDDAHGRAVLYLGFEGNHEVVELEHRRARAICERNGARLLERGEADSFWRDRHVIGRRFAENRRQRRERGRDGVYRDWIHVALPASKVLRFRSKARGLISRRGVQLQESGLWVHPELFSMRVAIEDKGSGTAQVVLQTTIDELLALAQEMGGSMEYTHGVGVKLASSMAAEHGYGLEIMRQIKRMLDPNIVLNPGKSGL